MPIPPVPTSFNDILESATLGHLATLDALGRPQVNPVWFIWDGEHILLSVKADTRKYRNVRRIPHVAISFVDPVDPHHYLELRGQVALFDLYLDLSFVNRLAQKYTGRDMDELEKGLERYKLTIEIRSWTGQ